MRRCCLWFAFLLMPLAAQTPPRGAPTTSQPPAPGMTTFRNLAGTFLIHVPEGWRQLAPGEARRLGENPAAPGELTLAQPLAFYAVGPVDQWLKGDFSSPWLYVVEQDHEWHLEADFAAVLAEAWRKKGEASGERHELRDVKKAKVGTQQIESVLAVRTCTPTAGRMVVQSLDAHVPSHGMQTTLCFCSAPDRFEQRLPTFQTWLATLTVAKTARAQASLGDRLWTPLLVGGLVGIVLLVLYKHSRRHAG